MAHISATGTLTESSSTHGESILGGVGQRRCFTHLHGRGIWISCGSGDRMFDTAGICLLTADGEQTRRQSRQTKHLAGEPPIFGAFMVSNMDPEFWYDCLFGISLLAACALLDSSTLPVLNERVPICSGLASFWQISGTRDV